jgi:hypothetical protein
MFWIVPAVAIIAVFTLVTVTVWSENRLKERETLYRHETYKKLIEQPGISVEAVRGLMLELTREDEVQRRFKQIEGEKLGGLITAVVGVALAVFLYSLAPERPIYLVGGIPFSVGLMLLLHSYMLQRSPRTPPRQAL